MYVMVRWGTLLNPESESILPCEWLNDAVLSRVNWNTQISGITIWPDVVEVLEGRWSDFLIRKVREFSLFRRVLRG
jgi:hypothetical protein